MNKLKPCPYCYGKIGGAHEEMCPNKSNIGLLSDAWLTQKQRDKKYGAKIPPKFQTNDLPPFLERLRPS